jgi:hypothetical protein
VRYKVPADGISSEEAMRFGLGSSNPGYKYKMMCNMGWRGGAMGKQADGIATAITGKSIGGQISRSGVGTQSGGASTARRSNTKDGHRSNNRRGHNGRDRNQQHKRETTRAVRWTDIDYRKRKTMM